MGYTSYWLRKKTLGPEKFRKAVEDCKRVCLAAGVPLRKERDSEEPAVFRPSEVRFNGISEDGHEAFYVPRIYVPEKWQTPTEGLWFDFCKTARKAYDLPVCACLIVFAHYFGDSFRVSSDGDLTEAAWPAALDLVQETCGYGADFKLRE